MWLKFTSFVRSGLMFWFAGFGDKTQTACLSIRTQLIIIILFGLLSHNCFGWLSINALFFSAIALLFLQKMPYSVSKLLQ